MLALFKQRYLVRAVAFGLILLGSACVIQEGIKSESIAEYKEKTKKECRYMASTGSRMRRSQVCLTKEEWEVVDARQQELDENMDRESDEFFRESVQSSGRMSGTGLNNPNTPSP